MCNIISHHLCIQWFDRLFLKPALIRNGLQLQVCVATCVNMTLYAFLDLFLHSLFVLDLYMHSLFVFRFVYVFIVCI